MSKNRLEAFSDGVFAIIITIIVLGITFPSHLDSSNIRSFLWEIFIFVESGVMVGTFWFAHSELFDRIESVSAIGILYNILLLLVLSLVPLFTKGLMQNPNMTFSAIGFTVIMLLAAVILHLLTYSLKMNDMVLANWKFRTASFSFVLIVGVISFYSPRLASLLFIFFPIMWWTILLATRKKLKQ